MTTGAPPSADGHPESESLFDRLVSALRDGSSIDSIRARWSHDPATFDAELGAARRYLSALACLSGEVELPPGTRLGAFEIIELIGTGGSAHVYRARQVDVDRDVALKVLHPGTTDEETRRRFRDEARHVASIFHEHLARIIAAGEHADRLFYAMELIDGPTLQQVLAGLERPTTVGMHRAIARWGSQIARALAALHARGRLHRDVKPSNIMIRDAPRAGPAHRLSEAAYSAVLVDYGLVHSMLEETTGSRTDAYASPEQLGHTRKLDARSDVFSLGATLRDLTCVRRRSSDVPAANHLDPLDEVPHLERDLAAILGMATEARPEHRYESGAALARDLDAFQRSEVVEAATLPVLVRARRALERHPERILRWTWRSAGALVIVACIAWAGAAVSRSLEASEALARGELPAAHRMTHEIPRWVAALWPGLGPHVLDETQDAALREVLALLDDGDALPAMRRAAAALRLDGVAAHPLLRRWLVHTASTAQARVGPEKPAARVALELIAQICAERPDGDPMAVSESAPFRALLRERWAVVDDTSTREHILKGLSGCGTPADASRIFGWALAQPVGRPARRMALLSVERIVRRASRCGAAEDLAQEFLNAVFESTPQVLATLSDSTDADVNLPSILELTAMKQLALAAVLAARARGEPPATEMILPASDLEALSLGRGLSEAGLTFTCAIGDPRVTLSLVSWEAEELTTTHAFGQGVLAGCLDDEQVTRRVRTALTGHSGGSATPLLEAFDEGVGAGSELKQGIVFGVAPDADSLLGANCPFDERSLPPGEAVAARACTHADGPPEELITAKYDGSEASASRRRRDGVLAACDFRVTPAMLLNTITSVEAHEVEQVTAVKSDYLRLGRRSESRLVFRFRLREPAGDGESLLRLTHLAASRNFEPYRGVARLHVSLDDDTLAENYAVDHAAPVTDVFRIAPERLWPGEHRIEIRLTPASTTTYRLYGVELISAPGSD